MQNIVMIVVLIHALQFFTTFLFTEIGAFKSQMPQGWLMAAIFKFRVTILLLQKCNSHPAGLRTRANTILKGKPIKVTVNSTCPSCTN
jgi:hypothetical protein